MSFLVLMGGQMGRALAGGEGAAAVAQVLLIFDQFTGADGTDLDAHTIAPTNVPAATWTLQSEGANVLEIVSNKIVCNGAARTYGLVTTGYANGLYQCVVNLDAGARSAGLILRWQDINTHWMVLMQQDTGAITLYERVAGVYNSRAATTMTVAAATDYLLSVTMDGSAFAVYVDGVAKLAFSSATLADKTIHGIRSSTGTARADDFKVYQYPFLV